MYSILMRATQSCMAVSAQGRLGATVLPSRGESFIPWDGVERVLMETRSRIMGALDRELDHIRATYQAVAQASTEARTLETEAVQGEAGTALMEAPPLPQNVVTVSRELFMGSTPQEAVLDPALEQATVEELNAALADAFNHVSGQ
jgi:hypothetical protein